MATTNNDGKTLVVLLGATATGKTDVGIALARAFGSEIVSSDSRQIYREMSIGTAKPTEEELSAVPHHLIGTRSVREDYSAGRYEQDALRVLEERFREHDILFLVGGSGLYIDAVCYGMDELPAVDPHLRKTLVRRAQTEGLESLFEELRKLDPAPLRSHGPQQPSTSDPRIGSMPAERPTVQQPAERRTENAPFSYPARRAPNVPRRTLRPDRPAGRPHDSRRPRTGGPGIVSSPGIQCAANGRLPGSCSPISKARRAGSGPSN